MPTYYTRVEAGSYGFLTRYTGLVCEGEYRENLLAHQTGFRTQEQALRWASGWLRGATEIRDDLDERGSASLWIRDAENRNESVS